MKNAIKQTLCSGVSVLAVCFTAICGFASTNSVDPEEASLSTIGPWVPDLGNGTYKNPVLYADYSDPDVVRNGDDYYMTSSSFNCTPGLPILHSNDLVNWTIIGHVFDQQTPAGVYNAPLPADGVWAPSIRVHNDTFYITYGDPDYGVYLAKSANPQGPWTSNLIKPAKGWIDVCPFWDDDGQSYIVHAYASSRAGINSILTIRRLSNDASQITDSIMVIDGNTTAPDLLTTIEGPKLYKRNGYYYILAPAGGVTAGWQMALRAQSITGPWEYKKVMEQGTTAINGPHQGGWVETPDGKESWFLHFQDNGAYGRVVHLEPMTWVNDWPVIGSDPNGDGIGNPVATASKPNVGASYSVETPQTSDAFDSDTLGPQWQWYANSQPGWMSLAANKGFLRLYSVSLPSATPDYRLVPNLLLQKFCADSFVATAKAAFHPRITGERSGMIVVGGAYSLLAVVKKADGIYLTNSAVESASDSKLQDSTVYMRLSVVGPSAQCKFSYSIDGRNFIQAGSAFTATKIKWIGAKFGLFASKPYGSDTGGYADFAWINVSKEHASSIKRASPDAGGERVTITPDRFGRMNFEVNLHERFRVSIELYNALGEKIEVLENRIHDKGAFSLAFRSGRYSAGIYFIKITIGSTSAVNCCRFF
jgi:beta-xylosidase